jgi:hypothetical protein
MHRRILVKVAVCVGVLLMGGAVASAQAPGPGDKQCVPGQNGNPHPAFKAGVCSNP